MVLTPVRPSTMHKVRFWDPMPNGNQLPPELRESMFRLYTDMELYFGVRRQMVNSQRVEVTWPANSTVWDKLIRDRYRRLFYVYDEDRRVIAIGETMTRPRSFYHDIIEVRVFVSPEMRNKGIGTAMLGVIDYVTSEDAYNRGADETMTFNAFDPEPFKDDACLYWLQANNYQRRDDRWVRVV